MIKKISERRKEWLMKRAEMRSQGQTPEEISPHGPTVHFIELAIDDIIGWINTQEGPDHSEVVLDKVSHKEPKPLKLEVWREYKTRSGKPAFMVHKVYSSGRVEFKGVIKGWTLMFTWDENGESLYCDKAHSLDLVEEVD